MIRLLVILAALTTATAAKAAAQAQGPTFFGWVDVAYAHAFTDPPDRDAFAPFYGSSVHRADEFVLNLAALGVRQDPAPVGYQLVLQAGASAAFVHAGEPTGAAIGPDVFRFVQTATASWKPYDALLLEVGKMPAFVGFETFPAYANFNTTRGLLAELSPYYLTGASALYAITGELSARAVVVNGWQSTADFDHGKSLGAQLAWSTEPFSISAGVLTGDEPTGRGSERRTLVDCVAQSTPLRGLTLAASLDLGYQVLPGADTARWQGAGLWARWEPIERVALAVRGEIFRDEQGFLTGTAQMLREVTATLQYAPTEELALRLEGRLDRSSAAIFSSPDGPVREQPLVVLSAIAGF